MKICHLTSAHQRNDTRIFIKMCSSLSKVAGYDVSLIVADGLGNEIKNNVNILDVGAKTGGRLSRMTKTVNKLYHKALEIDADIYHLHDPELMPIGIKLKKSGKKVIFDAHEDLPKQLLGKPYLNKIMQKLLSEFFTFYEKINCSKFDYIVAATPIIRDKFLNINPNSIDINNYPILGELISSEINLIKKDEICYVGGISEIRGVIEVVEALSFTLGIRLNLVGAFESDSLKDKVQKSEGWNKVNDLGFQNREEVANIMATSKAGLVTFYPLPNHIDAQPNKMFEYMSVGLPIITSNFPLWRQIVEDYQCGVCVDPLNPKSIAEAMQYIIENPEKAKQMGKNGQQAINERYNWSIEANKLYEIYSKLLGNDL